MYVLASVLINVTIQHRFLKQGHTQNEGDSVHALIEKKSSNEKIYVPNHWYEIIRKAKITDPKYSVIELSLEKNYNFKDSVSKQNWDKNQNKKNVSWSQVKDLKIDKNLTNKL